MVEIERYHEAGVEVIAPSGRIDTTTAPTLETAIGAAIDGGARRLLVDLAGVPYISSGGLRVLLAAARRLREPGDAFALAALAPEVERVMRLTGFSTILSCHATRDEGIAALRED
ncbi:MAG TPA: STAS domain-containing protein [Methanoregulaceae archaeon]|nr:STAS domain-containing protein [Methanoregulaceae archaeon]HOV67007.1 STAS domain-containing protein [Methanoregulaceae archaeon]HQJ87985.1 STAS domain-containing protein [Methanoregulaceae archaeon]